MQHHKSIDSLAYATAWTVSAVSAYSQQHLLINCQISTFRTSGTTQSFENLATSWQCFHLTFFGRDKIDKMFGFSVLPPIFIRVFYPALMCQARLPDLWGTTPWLWRSIFLTLFSLITFQCQEIVFPPSCRCNTDIDLEAGSNNCWRLLVNMCHFWGGSSTPAVILFPGQDSPSKAPRHQLQLSCHEALYLKVWQARRRVLRRLWRRFGEYESFWKESRRRFRIEFAHGRVTSCGMLRVQQTSCYF